jgi:hypothetical protein
MWFGLFLLFALLRWWLPAMTMLALPVGGLLNQAVSILVGRSRSSADEVSRVIGETDAAAYPSGHVIGAVMLYGLLFIVADQYRQPDPAPHPQDGLRGRDPGRRAGTGLVRRALALGRDRRLRPRRPDPDGLVAAYRRYYGVPRRITWTVVGVLLGFYWLTPESWQDRIVNVDLKGGMELFAGETAKGSWDIAVSTSRTNPVPDVRAALALALAFLLVYGLAILANDAWGEQLVKRGWTTVHIPSVLWPAVTPAWGVVLATTVVVYLLFLWALRRRARAR